MTGVQQVYLALAPEMKLLIRLLLLISLFLSGGHSLYAGTQTTGSACNVAKSDRQTLAALPENITTPTAGYVHARKATTRKNCRKLLIVDDEDDETVSFKKTKPGKNLPAVQPARNSAAVFYNSSSSHLLSLGSGPAASGRDLLLPSCYSLLILFQVFRI